LFTTAFALYLRAVQSVQYVLSDLRLQGVLTGLREGEMERELLLTELEYVSEVLTILTTMAE
jgi:hypothetical protein